MNRALLAAVLFVSMTAVAAADESPGPLAPREIIERAIAVQGGEEQVARLINSAWRAKVKGQRGDLKISGEIAHQGLGKGRITTSMSKFGLLLQVVVVHNGDKVWRSINGITGEVTGKELEEMRDGGYRSRRVRFLLPLVREPGFTLTSLPDVQVSKSPAVGVRVQCEGHRDVDVYFDKATGLLAKIESRLIEPGKQPIVLEQVISNYREFDGVKLGTKLTKYENGKVHSLEEFTDLIFVDHIDESEFEKP